jgi:CRP-like cAMP-binding protein
MMTTSPSRRRNGNSAASAHSRPSRNQLIEALPAREIARFLAHAQPVELHLGEVVNEQDAAIRDVYFPTGGFVSEISQIGAGSRLEVGLVGAEGMIGASLVCGVAVSPVRSLTQGAGMALRMSAKQFAVELERSKALRSLMNRYLYVRMSQLTQMAVCARFHLVDARLARWLLMTRDRARSDRFQITQEFMAFMLGVRRAGITEAAALLQQRNLIRYRRGDMTILNARSLQAVSCACYGTAERIYERHMN